MFNVVKEYEDIYIEVRSCLDGEIQMTIDTKKIIPKLRVPLEDEEWKKLKNMKLGALIRETYDDIIISVGDFAASATRIWKSKTKICGRDAELKETYEIIIITSITQRILNRLYYLESHLKTNCKENELLRPYSTRWSIWVSSNSINFLHFFLIHYKFFYN